MNDNYKTIEEKLGQYIQVGTRIIRTRDVNFYELEQQGPCFVIGNGSCFILKGGCFVEYNFVDISNTISKQTIVPT
ncbi:MAG: hypothetical protein GWO26_05965 [Phycisphaerae bacterium]|nr:hypothetical protein [Phycisphaerae bacterium]